MIAYKSSVARYLFHFARTYPAYLLDPDAGHPDADNDAVVPIGYKAATANEALIRATSAADQENDCRIT